jgi:hypothetical protein
MSIPGPLRLPLWAVAMSLATTLALAQSPVAGQARHYEDNMAQRTQALSLIHI